MPLTRESKVTIKIPRPLYRRLQQIIGDSGFDSVTDFVVYVLRDIVSNTDNVSSASESGDETVTLTGQEIELVRQRLRRLGYL